jgi:signal transduction histidine kinase
MLQHSPRPVGVTSARWRAVGYAVAALAGLPALVAVGMLVAVRETPDQLAYWVMDVLSALVYAAVVVVLLPRSRHPVAWILVLVAVGCGLSALATSYELVAVGHDLPAVGAVTVAGWWVWVPGTYASMALMPWLVVPRPHPLLVRVVAAVATVAFAMSAVEVATYWFPDLGNPLAIRIDGWQRLLARIQLWPDRAVCGLGLLGALWLGWRWLRARGDEGRGLGWLAVGVLFMTAAFVPVVFTVTGPEHADLVYELSGIALILAQAFLPVALLVVVLRQRLFGVDLAVSRVTVWALLTGAVMVGYAALAWLGGRLVPASEEVAGLVAVGLVVALGQPLRFWIQGRVDGLVYGHRTDPTRLLGALREPGASGPLDALVGSLRDGLRLGGVQVDSADGRVRALAGTRSRDQAELPLVVEGREVGTLRVSPLPGQRLDERTIDQLDRLRDVLAVALDLAVTTQQLETAGSRLVEVRMEERRMLRRDLHDGMGPALAGVGLGLAAAQRRLHHDTDGTARLLAELQAEVERRTDDLRLLARSLLPVQLDDGDLARALEVLGSRFAASGLAVHVSCRGAERLDTRHQLAVYHVAAEAVMNAYRHAAATRVDVDVAAGPGLPTVLEVRDDGLGMPADRSAGPGVGLTSMRERAHELRGTLTIAPGAQGAGTVVRMELP